MCQAQVCPFCKGSGQEWHCDPHTTSVGYLTTCHMCGGWGYIYPPCYPCCCMGCPRHTPPYVPPYTLPYWYYDGDREWIYSAENITVRINIIEDPNVVIYGDDPHDHHTLSHDHDSEHNPHDC